MAYCSRLLLLKYWSNTVALVGKRSLLIGDFFGLFKSEEAYPKTVIISYNITQTST